MERLSSYTLDELSPERIKHEGKAMVFRHFVEFDRIFPQKETRTEQIHYVAEALLGQEVEGLKINLADISSFFGINRGTLHSILQNPEPLQRGRPTEFTIDIQNAIQSKIEKSIAKGSPLTYCELKNNLWKNHEMYFNSSTLRSYISRNPSIKTIDGYPMEADRCKVKPEEIDHFFLNVQGILDEHQIPPSFIFNLDEVGFSEWADQRHHRCIVPADFEHDRAPIPLDRTKKRNSLLGCIAADGTSMKPLVVGLRQTIEGEFVLLGYQNVALVRMTPKGYINVASFMDWALLIFIPEIKKRREKYEYQGPALLVMDGLSAHKAADFEAICTDQNIIVVFFPAHSSDQLQMLDLVTFAVQKIYFAQIAPPKELNPQTTKFVKMIDSWIWATTPRNVTSAFERAGFEKSLMADGTLVVRINTKLARKVRHLPSYDTPPRALRSKVRFPLDLACFLGSLE